MGIFKDRKVGIAHPTMGKNWRKYSFRVGIVGVVIYFSACTFLFFRQQYFIFQPTRNLQKTPAAYRVPYQDVYLPVTTKSGKVEKIHGWWIPNQNPKLGTLLYLHGTGYNIGANVNQAYRFWQLGFSVLLIDYRGYGLSEGGFPSEDAVYQDAQTTWNYLVGQKKISANKIVIYGHSLGGAVAIALAVKNPQTAGLIVQGSFTSISQILSRYPQFKFFPIGLLLTNRFDSISKVKLLRMPVLFIHGTADPLIPDTMTKELYTAAPAPKQILRISGAKHNNGDLFFNSSKYRQAIQQFALSVRN